MFLFSCLVIRILIAVPAFPEYPLKFNNGVILDTVGDGNCFLYSLLDQLRLRNPQLFYSILGDGGNDVILYLREKTASNLDTVFSHRTQGMRESYLNDSTTLDEIRSKIAVNGVSYADWAIQSIASFLSVNIQFWHTFGYVLQRWQLFFVDNPVVTVNIYWNGRNHFETIHDVDCGCDYCVHKARIRF